MVSETLRGFLGIAETYNVTNIPKMDTTRTQNWTNFFPPNVSPISNVTLAAVKTPSQTNYTLVKENEHRTYTHNKTIFT